MSTAQRIQRRMHGLGLSDLMIGLAIGLLATLVILKMALLFEARRKSTTGISDAQMSASHALTSITRDLRMAGHGLGPPDALGCTIKRTRGGAALTDWTLWPVVIIDGIKGGPDTLLVLSSGKSQSLTAARLIAPYVVGTEMMMVNSTLGVVSGDTLLLHEGGVAQCPLITVTSVPIGDYRIYHQHLPSALVTIGTYQEGAAVINLGSIHYQRYTVNADAHLILERYNVSNDQWQSSALSSGMVNFQAQFGYDARPSPSGAPRITQWSTVLKDANANGTAGDVGDLRRILAVRIAVVSRSAQRSDQGCTSPIPTWRAANEITGEMQDTPIAVDTIADWACYRYRVLQAEVPLRNLIWSDS